MGIFTNRGIGVSNVKESGSPFKQEGRELRPQRAAKGQPIYGLHWDNIGIILVLYWGLYRGNGEEIEITVAYWGYIGITENKRETRV